MKKKEYLMLIENLNLENEQLVDSREYQLGCNMIEFKNMLKHFKIITILKKIIRHNRLKKYSHANSSKHIDIINNNEIKNKKIAIYTCIVGEYDNVCEPHFIDTNTEYYIITDNKNLKTEKFKKIIIPEEILKKFNNNNVIINRYYKLNPNVVFNDYDYTIYIDGNVNVFSDLTTLANNIDNSVGVSIHKHRDRNCIYEEYKVCKILKKGNINNLKKQLKRYKIEGFPNNYGMAECGIIVCDLKNPIAINIMGDWWNEFFNSESLRDQFSLPYILWKNNIELKQVTSLGDDCYKNPKFRVNGKHK